MAFRSFPAALSSILIGLQWKRTERRSMRERSGTDSRSWRRARISGNPARLAEMRDLAEDRREAKSIHR